MKKIIALILTLIMIVCMVACGTDKTEKTDTKPTEEKIGTETAKDTDVNKENDAASDDEAKVEENVYEESATDTKEQVTEKEEQVKENVTSKENSDTESKTEKNPQKPSGNSSDKPVEKPVETPAGSTLGTTLLADFKVKAAKGLSGEEIANELLNNPAILFMGGAMPVEEGLLSGFDNYEVKGFDKGTVFMPMIGSIPFVGYVFELKSDTDVNTFMSNLEKNANKRWNVCVEADEMYTASYGNKVFFIMCPKSLEE